MFFCDEKESIFISFQEPFFSSILMARGHFLDVSEAWEGLIGTGMRSARILGKVSHVTLSHLEEGVALSSCSCGGIHSEGLMLMLFHGEVQGSGQMFSFLTICTFKSALIFSCADFDVGSLPSNIFL